MYDATSRFDRCLMLSVKLVGSCDPACEAIENRVDGKCSERVEVSLELQELKS